MVDLIIQANKLSKFYLEGSQKTEVLKHLDLTCKYGESVVLTGCSGSGKSTLLHCLADLDSTSEGTVDYANTPWPHYSKAAKQSIFAKDIGFIYQFHYLLKDLNVIENVMIAAMIAGYSKQDSFDKASELLAEVGLETHSKQNIHHLSGGERQRVAVARALMCKPKLIFADEPTGSLDIKNAEHIVRLLVSYQKQHGTSIILTTHHLALTHHFDRHLKLENGVLIE